MNVSVPKEAILAGPEIQWHHVDGPLVHWAGGLHWLTLWERIQLRLGWTTVDEIGCKVWPRRAQARAHLRSHQQ